MSKREASMFAAQGLVDVDAPRAKRHKSGPQAPSTSDGNSSSPAKSDKQSVASGREVKQEQLEATDGVVAVVAEDPAEVQEKGLRVWQAVKDAVKDGRVLSTDFLRLPSKRQYPDYYELIKNPIALDQIKDRLEQSTYLTFNDCIKDLETCFRNAKRYNIKESQIFLDAKVLHKLVITEVAKLSGKSAANGSNTGDGGSDVEAEKKKQPNMTRLLKTRLQKLVDKKNSDGRVMSIEFMDLPNKKQWAVYYKTIKNPQCLENIFKKLKRKEYHTATDFAKDVELVFSNALEFNQEHTPIWEDALELRNYFRQLMSDLPPPFAIPAYSSSDHSTKIKLRMPNVPHPQHPVAPGPTRGTLTLRVPPQASPSIATPQLPNSNSIIVNSGKTATPKLKATPLVPETVHPKPIPAVASTPRLPTTPLAPSPVTTHSPLTFAPPAYPQHYPNAIYQPGQQVRTPTATPAALPNTGVAQRQRQSTPVQTQVLTLGLQGTSTASQPIAPRAALPPTTAAMITPALAMTTSTTPTLGTATVPSKSPSPATANSQRKLEFVALQTRPNGRSLDLDARDGVKTWAVRLGADEWSVHISGIKFFGVEDDDEDWEERMEVDCIEARKEEEEEETEEEKKQKEPEAATPKRSRGRAKRKAGKSSEDTKGKASAKPRGPIQLQIKLNGGLVQPLPEKRREWEVRLPVGYNVLEIGEKGGMVWRVYLERVGATAGVRHE